MNNKALTLSLVMAVLAVFMVQSYVASIEESARKKFGTEIVVITAKRDIKEMETINESLLENTLVPKKYLEPAAISSGEREAGKETDRLMKTLAGTVALVPIKKGEQITYNKLTEPSMRTGLAPQIAPGKRAVSIPVNEYTGVSKLVKPGDRIDVIAVIDAGGGKDGKLSKTILQDVVVLSVGRNVSNNIARLVESDPFGGKDRVRSLNEDSNFASIALEVDPQQAQALALVQAAGDSTMVISLRNNDDTDRVNLPSVTYGDVLGADASRIQRSVSGRR